MNKKQFKERIKILYPKIYSKLEKDFYFQELNPTKCYNVGMDDSCLLIPVEGIFYVVNYTGYIQGGFTPVILY